MELQPAYADGLLTCEVREGVCHLGLNDAEHMNAFSLPLVFGIHEAVRAALDAGHRRFVLFGHGDDFSAGANLVDYQRSVAAITQGDGFAEFYESERALLDLARLLRSPDVLSVASCQGWVIGQALEVIMACDFVVAAPGATFWLPESRWGWNVGMGTTYLLAHTIGIGWTRRMLLLNEKLPAERAEQLGLVARVGELGSNRELATSLLDEMAKAAPRALQSLKKLIDVLPATSLDDSRELELVNAYWLAHTRDVLEGATSFVERRPPVFRGS
ncbi:MAG TPA: enoyl-CoA hydratase/isomerase family protein [Gaiellaceae bacterium]|jgi:2-(1,2-epoxy-1,2-dihydrophenyl)acetyl-CoA isomerase